MGELLRLALRALKDIWHWRWLGLGVAWAVAILGTIIVLELPDRYEASARVYVDTDSVLKPLMAGMTVQPNIGQRVAILSRTLISRPNLEKLIRLTDMDHMIKTDKDREVIIESLSKNLKIQAAGAANLYTIHYMDQIPARAHKTVQSLLSIFMESSLGEKRQDSQSAREFIERQIKDYEQKLQEAENRLKEFRLRNMALLSGGSDHFAKMDTVRSALGTAKLELREAEESRDALKRELANHDSGDEPVLWEEAEPVESAQTTELDNRIRGLKKDLDELMRRFTDRHPDVQATQRLIAQLEEQKKAELEAKAKPQKSRRAVQNVNPVKQQLQFSLAEADARVAALRARVREYESQNAQLQANARIVPQIEAESAQMNRDYEVIKKQYGDLVARRESASLTGELEAAGSMASFRIIDPPRVDQKPAAPNRVLLLIVALGAAVAAGVAVSFLASQLMPTLHDASHLREISKRPVLGSVSLLETDGMRGLRRRAMLYFFGGAGGLVSSMGLVLAFIVLTRP